MSSDLFSHVPHHVTLLFLFLCSCQLFLVLHLHSLHAPASAPGRAPDDHVQVQQQHHGMLRLLWSVNTSNEVWEPQSHLETSDFEASAKSIHGKYPATSKPEDRDSPLNILPYYQQDMEEPGSDNFTDYTFTYVINQPYICQNTQDDDEEEDVVPVYLLVLIHSHPSHKPQRDAIRATWGKRDYSVPVRFVFVLGESESHPSLTALKHEADLYRDIIMGNFTDTYRNLTIKALFGLQWTQAYCSDVQYVLKTDDDTYFNTTRLLHYLKLLPANKPLILGSLNSKAAVSRRGLWQVTQDQFSAATYPSYCSGCAYVLSHSVLAPLLQAVHKVSLLPIEDVYITGILAQFTGTQCQSVRTFPYWSMGPSPRNLCMLLDNRLYGVHNVNYERMYFIHNKVRTGHTCVEKPAIAKIIT